MYGMSSNSLSDFYLCLLLASWTTEMSTWLVNICDKQCCALCFPLTASVLHAVIVDKPPIFPRSIVLSFVDCFALSFIFLCGTPCENQLSKHNSWPCMARFLSITSRTIHHDCVYGLQKITSTLRLFRSSCYCCRCCRAFVSHA